ncbi:large ribosomal subunit protein uL29m-like [Babylonia areolata]|uniref:large ribosomal subunit protein uL29m-like n=1 Tax=Babylonia areolata TaxID=304850 RepID=UPI003FD432CD
MAGSLRCALSSVSRFCYRHVSSALYQQNARHQAPIGNSGMLSPSWLHTTSQQSGLMEFFDDKKNWGEETVKTGRPWRVDELRIKSNSDLHKLWYVLLKERNMLLTMEHEYRQQSELFPNPERIEKVEESMENIMQVVKERDEAFHLLETGTSGNPGGQYVHNFLGLRVWKKKAEHLVPSFMNKFYKLVYPSHPVPRTRKYIALYREQQREERRKERRRETARIKRLEQAFPHLKGKLDSSDR